MTEDWHHRNPAETLAAYDTTAAGLAQEEAARRLAAHGPNELAAAPPRHPLLRLLDQFNNALIGFLLAAAVAAGLMGHHVDAAVIVVVVMVNAIVGFVQEGRAEQALAAIRAMVSPHASVLRGGRRTSVRAADLVPGDIVLLEPGDRVPADLRLLQARGLLIDEAILTGESVAAHKHDAPVTEQAALGDRTSMAFSGTLVTAGQGRGVVVATGADTQIGRISGLIGQVQQLTTPLLRQINAFGRRFTLVAILSAALLFVVAVLLRGYGWEEALMVVVALAVGVVPEGLPAVITITLAIGVQRMAARRAAVRRLPAVETLGATSVICSDKTGTLTRNEMTVQRIVTADQTLMVDGAGYAPEGTLSAAPAPAARALIRAGLLCNDAQLRQADGVWRPEGDAMEAALVALAIKAGLDPRTFRASHPRTDAIPFDARYRFMATLNTAGDGTAALYVKGAPERLLELCTAQLGAAGAAPLDAGFWQARIDAAAAEGERVLGFAMRRMPPRTSPLHEADVETDLVFLGLVGLIDPPREEARAAVAECRRAGIAVKMITGDHAATATAIARQLGLADAPETVTGAELDEVADDALPALARRADVFARTSPEHKLRLVQALQADGAVVAMTGDGVNDAPALKQADVGVAMGMKGTEAAKEASEMVLLDDNFASIVAAVREGRTVYDNIRKVVAWTIPTNAGEALAIVVAILLGLTLPMTPLQILWINMVLTVTLGLVLAFEPTEPGVMERRPRRASAPLLSPFLLWRVMFVSLLFTAAIFAIFAWAGARGHDVATARTMVVNTLVVLEIFYLFNIRHIGGASITWRGLLGTPAVLAAVAVVVAAQFAFTYLPAMQAVFDARPVPLLDGLVIVSTGIALMLVLEAEKAVLRRLGHLER